MPNHPKTVGIPSFKGLNNVLKPERTPMQYLKEAENIDVDKTGGIQKREGYALIDAGSYHSIWSDDGICLAVRDNDLVQIHEDYSYTILYSDIGSDAVSFFRLDDLVYLSSVSVNGVIDSGVLRPWGIERPNPRPTLVASSGALDAGTYQVVITYSSVDGRESGASVAEVITVSDASSISVTDIPTSADSTVDTVNIYMSEPNGEVLYYLDSIDNGTNSYDIHNYYGLVRPLDTFNLMPAPKGHIVVEAHGRSWVAEDNFLWHSEAFAYEHFNMSEGYMRFPARIRAIMPTEGGLWVAADKLYYLAGENPATMKMEMREPIKVVEGSPVRIPGAYIFIENTPIGYKWLFHSDKGIYVAFNDGITLNMTSQNYEFPSADEGTAAFMQVDGINKYVSLLKQPKSGSDNTAVGDLVTATIIRNGVVVEE